VKPLILLAEAVEDLENARDFYDRQEQGVGDHCVHSLIADMERLADRFPFGMYYQIIESTVCVVAVLDLRRDPSWIRSEMEKRS
jgi:hypothetical protein